MALTLVLSVGLNASLLSARNLVLQSAGYTVIEAFSLKEAIYRFQDGDFDLVLLCQSIPTIEVDRLTCWIRASGSRVPVVSVAGDPAQRATFIDATVVDDPNVLLEAVRDALVKAAAQTAIRDRQKAAVLQGKKQPQPSVSHEPQAKTANERVVPLAHAS